MKNRYFSLGALLAGTFSLAGCFEDLPNPAAGTLSPVVAIKYVRELYNGDPVVLESARLMDAHRISGIVISDPQGKNLPAGYLVLQNKNKGDVRGITVDVGAGAQLPFVPGDSVTVDVTGGTLTRKQGTLLITGLQPADVVKAGANQKIIVQQVATGTLHSNFGIFESTLVQVPNADVVPAPGAGQTFAGEQAVDDGSGGQIKIATASNAAFAQAKVPLNASFVGIPTFFNESRDTNIGARLQLRLRTGNDAQNPSGAKYAAFPETFETNVAKGSYNMPDINNNIQLSTGNWKLYQAILGNTFGSDRYNPSGSKAIRIQQNLSEPAYVQMNFDVPNGASKVTVSYGSYGSDVGSTFRLEYSQDGGTTWTQVGADVTNASSTPQLAIFPMDLQGPVRFRINKLGLGTSSTTPPVILNGRLNIDDFTIYQRVN